MSHTGKINRGKKWYAHRNVEGVLHPEVANDPNKMVDVDYYLDFENKRKEAKEHGFDSWEEYQKDLAKKKAAEETKKKAAEEAKKKAAEEEAK